MSVAYSQTRSLAEVAAAAPSQGRIVMSRLPRGETLVSRSSLSLKIVLKGEERYLIDRRVTRLVAGHALLVDSGEATRVILPGEQSLGLCFYFPQSQARPTLERIDLPPAPLPLIDHPLGDWIRRLANDLDRDPDLGPSAAGALLERTGAHLENFVADACAGADRIAAERKAKRAELFRRVEVARAFLHSAPHRVITLEELASVAGVSAFHLARCFRDVHGAPPATYHRNWRLDRAAAELKCGKASTAELAADYGFADQASFIRAFGRRHGISPGRYKADG